MITITQSNTCKILNKARRHWAERTTFANDDVSSYGQSLESGSIIYPSRCLRAPLPTRAGWPIRRRLLESRDQSQGPLPSLSEWKACPVCWGEGWRGAQVSGAICTNHSSRNSRERRSSGASV